jgi:RNA polymerase sigma-70 factor (ECF subfamily)
MSTGGLIQIFIDTRPALHRFLVARGAAPNAADDILQDMSLRLAAGGLGPVTEPRAYLYKMASNHFQLQRRSEGRRAQREEDWAETRSDGDGAIDPEPSAEEAILHREHLAILDAALARLPDRTRVIFLRFRLEHEPQKQIAADLAISVSAVEKHLARAYEEIAATRIFLDGEKALPRHLRQDKGAV